MMIYWAEALAISGIEGIAILDFFPTGELTYGTFQSTIAMKLDVEQLGILQFVGHIVIHAIYCQLYIDALCHLVFPVHHSYSRNVFSLLYCACVVS